MPLGRMCEMRVRQPHYPQFLGAPQALLNQFFGLARRHLDNRHDSGVQLLTGNVSRVPNSSERSKLSRAVAMASA